MSVAHPSAVESKHSWCRAAPCSACKPAMYLLALSSAGTMITSVAWLRSFLRALQSELKSCTMVKQ